MNPELRVLVVSWAFAPDREIGAKRVTRFCNYLPTFGIQPIVLTVRERFLEHRDDEFLPPCGIRLERTTKLGSPLDAYSWLRSRIRSRNTIDECHPEDISIHGRPSNKARGVRRHMLALLNCPDRYQGWYLPAVRAANRLIRREPVNAILSSGPPFTSHLIAGHLRKKHSIPWVADFRDPWVESRSDEGPPQWVLRMHRRMEAGCVKHADLVICNTDSMRRSFLPRYPRMKPEKFVTLTNGYDDTVKPLRTLRRNLSATFLLHFGSIYGRRRIGTFCQAITGLVNTGKLCPDSFRIVFHGDINPSSLADARQYASDLIDGRRIEFEAFIDSWQEAQKILWTADILLVFSAGPIIVPAKFYEYLKTGKPILAVAEKGALTDLIDMTGSGAWADPNDPTAIANALLKVLQMTPLPPEEVERRWDARFHFRSLTGQLAEWLRDLAARNGVS